MIKINISRGIYKGSTLCLLVFIAIIVIHNILLNIFSVKIVAGEKYMAWVQSQNGNDNEAVVNIKRVGKIHDKLKYSVEKYAEIGIIALPDINTFFSAFYDGMKIRDIRVAPYVDGFTIVDHNKTSSMNGRIRLWRVVSKEDRNEVRLAVFRYDNSTRTYQLVQSSPLRIAQKGLNTFVEGNPISIKQNDILGLQTKRPVSSNRVMLNERGLIYSISGLQSKFNRSQAVEDGGAGSFSFSALLESGQEYGEIASQMNGEAIIKLPLNPVYGHTSWYKLTFVSGAGTFLLKPGLAYILLNADPYIGLIPNNTSPWQPQAFSLIFFGLLFLLFICIALLISNGEKGIFWECIPIAGILIIYALSKYPLADFPGSQFVVIASAFTMIFLLPGVIISRYYSSYNDETVSGRIILAFVLSLVYWILPAFGIFLVKTSYWPVILALFLLIVPVFLKQPARIQRHTLKEALSQYWRTIQIMLWVIVGLIAVHTFFSSRFHAVTFDSFHHISIAAKNSVLPVLGDRHPNLYDATMRSVAPYAYNFWGLLVGLVVKLCGLDIGSVYCVGSSILVLLKFVAHWWLIGLFVNSEKIRISAFAIIIGIYITRTLATFAVIFQRSEFAFIMYGPSVHEFVLYSVYIVLGIRTLASRKLADLIIYCGLSLAMAFFHLEFIFINSVLLLFLIIFTSNENGKLHFKRAQSYLLTTVILMFAAGFIVVSRLALGKVVNVSSPYYAMFYALRYADKTFLQKFYYLFKDLLTFINGYIWNVVAIWGGVLLVIFPGKKINARLFNVTYTMIISMLVFSYNPLSEMLLTSMMTSCPLKRIEIYLRPIIFTFAAIVLSVLLFSCINFVKKYSKSLYKLRFAFPAVLMLLILFAYARWWSQMIATIDTITYNRGNYLDISYVANLPEMKYLNKYAEGKYVSVFVEPPYNYVVPSLGNTYSFYHDHYPQLDPVEYNGRDTIAKACLNDPNNYKSQLPDNILLMIRNGNAADLIRSGYIEMFRGRLFTILKHNDTAKRITNKPMTMILNKEVNCYV